MQKRVKFTLYVILILVIIVVVWLMFWTKNSKEDITTNTEIETLTWEEITDNNDWDTVDLEPQNNTFEDDVMNDLEWFFNDNNGYKDIQWEYWFTNPENE